MTGVGASGVTIKCFLHETARVIIDKSQLEEVEAVCEKHDFFSLRRLQISQYVASAASSTRVHYDKNKTMEKVPTEVQEE